MADMDKHDRIVWIDLEMTGLDIHEHTIVEVAALITDADLKVRGWMWSCMPARKNWGG